MLTTSSFSRCTPPQIPTLARNHQRALADILRRSNARSQARQAPHQREQEIGESSDEDEEDLHHTDKKQKCPIRPSNFSYGTSASQSDLLQHYPGKEHSSTNLAVDELLGPAILTSLIKSGTDIMTLSANSFKHWKKTYNGQPSNAEMEAVTLGRIIHLEMLTHTTPKEALENRPSLEVALRRLYAILFAEEAIIQGDHIHKKDAWNDIKDLMEPTQQGTISSEQVSQSVTKRLTIKRKRLLNLKAIKDNKNNNRPPFSYNPRPSRYPSSGANRGGFQPQSGFHRPFNTNPSPNNGQS